MRIGIQTFFGGHEAEPLGDFIIGAGRILEERGFASIWVSEHVVGFKSYDPAFPYPYADDHVPPEGISQVGMIDPMTALTVLATHTRTLKLSPGVAILPQRNPVYFAKQAAAIDQLSGGRFMAGVGLGWSAQEYAATGTPFEKRGERMDDYLQVIRALWCDDVSRFDGRYYSLPECFMLPKPVQRPHPPFYIGGESKPAMRRVAAYAQGWVAFRLLPEELEERLPYLRAALDAQGRSLDDIDIIVSPGEKPCDVAMLERYAALGVSQVVMLCLGGSLADFEAAADGLAERFVGAAAEL